MQKILINGRFSSHHFAIRNVIFNIAKQISSRTDIECYIILNKDSDITEFKKLPIKIILNDIPADSGAKNHLFTIFKLPILLRKYKIDVVIYPQICIFLRNPCKSILYMHDLIEYKVDSQNWKKMLFRKISYPFICKTATKIVAVSKNTKNDLHTILHVPEQKVVVAYDGKDESLYPMNKELAREYVKKTYGIADYIFYIGYLSHPQKNLLYLIDEFEEFSNKYPGYTLVFAGPKGKDADLILEKARKAKIKFKYVGKVPYKDLTPLYSGCEWFTFPSLYEGFGMPVLEAMSCGCAVITSNSSSIPEIIGDSEWTIDPQQKGALSSAFERMVKTDRAKIENENLNHSKQFTWDNHGNVINGEISKLLNN